MAEPIYTVEVEGLLKTQMRLEELGVVKIPAAMRKVVVAGAKPMRAAIRSAEQSMTTGQSRTLPGGLLRGIRYKSGRTTKTLASIAGAHAALSYYVVGPFGKGTAHRHLVIDGHEIVGHAPNLTRTGKRTTPVPFVKAGAESARGASAAAIEAASRIAIEEATKL
jgi:hypothetical protein